MARPLIDFLTKLQNKAVRTTNMWELEITTGYKDVDDKLKDVTLWASGFNAPKRSQKFADVHFKGYKLNVPTNIDMDQEHSMDVRCDVNGDIRRVFLKWQNYITNMNIAQGSTFGGEKRISKTATIRLKMLGMDMSTVVETIKLYGCGIEDVGEMVFKQEGADVTSFQVKFKSQYWETESTVGDFPEQK